MWLKRYHPAAFFCALLNQQSMGFYGPEVLLGDARRHGVEVRAPDVNRSEWRYTLERAGEGRRAWVLRTGLQTIQEVGEVIWQEIAAARRRRLYGSRRLLRLHTPVRRSRAQPAPRTAVAVGQP